MAEAIISRASAREQGLTRYFSGAPCARGHVAERWVGCASCTVCHRERVVPQATRDKDKQWREANAERQRQKAKAWREANPERFREARNRWAANNVEKVRQSRNRHNHVRRAREKCIDGEVYQTSDIAEILAAQNYRCAYCHVDLRKAKRHIDHVTPLALGGSNGRSNLQICCARCKLSKGARDPLEFARSIGRLL